MNVLELYSWRIDENNLRLHAEALVEGVEDACWCKASILLGELSDWPTTMEERLAFLDTCDDWTPVDEGDW